MARRATKLRVFVASPGDVAAERDKLATVVNELNIALSALVPNLPAVVEIVRWETHTYPALGRPQGVINEQIGDYDVFVGIMWRRFGTPTGEAASGTEEEFRRAYESWQSTGRPHVMFYFSSSPAPPPRTSSEVAQLERVVNFRTEMTPLGLVWEYDGPGEFAETIRPHLTQVVGRLLHHRRARRKQSTPEIEDAAPGAVTAQEVTEPHKGSRISVVEVGPEDAFNDAPEVIGQIIIVDTVYERSDGWYAGSFVMETPFPGLEDGRLALLQFKFNVVR